MDHTTGGVAIQHTAVVVRDIQKARRFYMMLGFKAGRIYAVGEQYPEEAQEHIYYGCTIRSKDKGPSIWLMQPKSKSGPLARFLRERGEGLHHIGIEVGSMQQVCRKLSRRRVRLIRAPHEFRSDKEIRALIHPSESFHTLLELVQRIG